MFDSLIEDVYNAFKEKMKSGAYVEPDGNIYSFSKDVYNSFFYPKFSAIKYYVSKNPLNIHQKQVYDLYYKTHHKFVQSSTLLFFTVYNLKDKDLHYFINEYERLKKEKVRAIEEEKRRQTKEQEKIFFDQQRAIIESIKSREMVLEFKGIEKIKNMSLRYNGGSITQVEFKTHWMPLKVYMYLDNLENFSPKSLPIFGLDHDLEFDVDAPEDVVNYDYDVFLNGEFDDSCIFDIIDTNFENFSLIDVKVDYIEGVSIEEQEKITKACFESIKVLDDKFGLLNQIKFEEVDLILDSKREAKSLLSDNELFDNFPLFKEIKKTLDNDYDYANLVWPQLLFVDASEETNLYLNIHEPSKNNNLKLFFDTNPQKYSTFNGDKVLLNQTNQILYSENDDVNEIDVYSNETSAYVYIPLDSKYPTVNSLEEKYELHQNESKESTTEVTIDEDSSIDSNESVTNKSFNRSEKVIVLESSKFVVDSLRGKNIVITGTLKHFTRNTIKETIEKLGGKVQSDINNATSFLLVGFENTGSKLDKAKEKGILVLNEGDFINIITNDKNSNNNFEMNNNVKNVMDFFTKEKIEEQNLIENDKHLLKIKEKLSLIKELFESGLISEEEFHQKKKTIIEDI